MPKIIFISHDGTERSVDAEVGQSVMQVAINNLLPGIIADCGGNCSCATCHTYIDEAWLDKLPAASSDELAMIDCALNTQANSRLSCQIRMTPQLDGVIVRTPASQT
jgi:ferredoxin, 2Fe-2S